VPLVLALVLALAPALASAAEPLPESLVCRGNEPSWTLRVDGAEASWTTPEAPSGQALRGRLTRAEWARPPLLVYRGSAAGEGVLVALVTREGCADTMADERFEWSARLSLPDGSVRLGCCRASAASAAAPPPALPAAVPPPGSSADVAAAPATPGSPRPVPPAPAPPRVPAPAPAPAPAPPAVTAVPAPAPAPAAPSVGGRVMALALEDGTVCRSPGRGATLAFGGRRVNFTCPPAADGRGTVLLGPLEPGPRGTLLTRWGSLTQEQDRLVFGDEKEVAVRVAEIETADRRVCVSPPVGPQVVEREDRVTFSCGQENVDFVVLLGELEAAPGGFAVTRAVVAREDVFYVVRSRERIRIAAP